MIQYIVHFERFIATVYAENGYQAVVIAAGLAPLTGEWGAILCAHA